MSAPGRQRPLSPFMLGPYYRFQLTSVLSFAHRLTGVGLALGALLLAGWLGLIAAGSSAYAPAARFLSGPWGTALMVAWSWALLYHLCNGIRHLGWDLGHGFSMRAVYASGWTVVVASVLLTGALWALAGL